MYLKEISTISLTTPVFKVMLGEYLYFVESFEYLLEKGKKRKMTAYIYSSGMYEKKRTGHDSS